MKSLTNEGLQAIEEIAGRYDLKVESVEALVNAVIKGNGSMAQFNIPELGGNGQWMKGGMTMVGDMFNNSLKAKVDKLCTELSNLVSTKVIFEESHEAGFDGKSNLSDSYWPPAFGSPSSSGAQNNFKYAYFGPVRRLVIEEDGKRRIFDTKHHQISGISQQQGSGRSYQFTSQEGPVDIADLALISEPNQQTQETPGIAYDVTHAFSSNTDTKAHSPEDIIIATIEKINILFEKGQITEEEFKTKKKELLARL